MTNSKDWKIARTIYLTLSLKGKVVLDNHGDGKQTLAAGITDLKVSKLDFHLGGPEDQKPHKFKDEDEDFDEEDSTSDDEEDPTLTKEGGLIQGLINM